MADLRCIQSSLFLILVLQLTATGQRLLYIAVRDGEDVTLPCNSPRADQRNCDSTSWLFSNSRRTVLLVENRMIGDKAKDKSDRLSVSENCSLVIKKVKGEDVGQYVCRQSRSTDTDAQVYLSVVTLTEHTDTGRVKVDCVVSSYLVCEHAVKWLLQGHDVDTDNKDLVTSQSFCSAALEFLTSHFLYASMFKSLMCEVTRGGNVQKFPLRNPPSGDKTGEDTTATEADETTTTSTTREDSPEQIVWWHVVVPVLLVALFIIITIAAVIKCKRTNGEDGNVGLTSDPAPETSPDTADPQEGVSYASVSYTRKPNGDAQGRSKHDDDDAVTYATVKHSSTAPSSLSAPASIT